MSDLCVGYGCMNADDGIRLRSSSRKRRMSLAWQRNNGNFTLSSSSNVDVVVHWTSTTALEEIPEQSQSRRKTLQTCDVSPSYGDLPAAWWWIQKQGTLYVCAFFSIVLLVLCPLKLRRVQKQQANGLRWTVRCAFAPSSCRTSEIKERQKKNSSEVKKQKEEKKNSFIRLAFE